MPAPRLLNNWLSEATTALSPIADSPRSEARRLITAVCGWDAGFQIAEPDHPLTRLQEDALAALLARRLAHEPLSRILGRREFWGLDFDINGATLDPRADTETLVELVLSLRGETEPVQILDLGTGSGAVLLALLHVFESAQGLGVDQDAPTLETATRNASALGLAARARFVQADWMEGLQGRFDLIVSNPPYIPTGDLKGLERAVQDFDDPRALDGGADGLNFYRRTLERAAAHLTPGGLLAVELGVDQSASVKALAAAQGWTVAGEQSDLAGIPRALALIPAA